MSKSVLFVCTGNTCRSVMAEGLLRKLLEGKPQVEVVSAGTSVYDGKKAADNTVSVMKEEGIDVSNHLTRQLTDDIINKSDLIFAMEERHKDYIIRRVPKAADKAYLLRIFAKPDAPGIEVNIPDPIGMDISYYRHIRDLIKECVVRVAKLF